MDQALIEEIIRQARAKSGIDSMGIPPLPDYMAQVTKSPYATNPGASSSPLPQQGQKVSSKDPNQQRYPDIPAPVEDQKALEAMIAQQRRGAAIGSFEKGMTNATKSILTTGAAIRLGANPVPDMQPTGGGEGIERGSQFKNKMYEASQGRAMDNYQTKVKVQEAQKQRDLEQMIAQMQTGSREKIAEMDSGDTRWNNPLRAQQLALQREQFEASQNPDTFPNRMKTKNYELGVRTNDRNDLGENRRQVGGVRMPATYLNKAIPLQGARRMMQDISEAFDNGDIRPGPVTGRLQDIENMFGIESPDTATSISKLMNSLAGFVLSKTGQQASAREYAILKTILPSLVDNPPAFKARVDNFLKIIDIDLNNLRDIGAGQNFDMSPIGGKKITQFPNVTGLPGVNKMAPAPSEGQTAPVNQDTRMYNVINAETGEMGQIPGAKIHAALSSKKYSLAPGENLGW